jgi:SAM-dependent methyltransferase
MDRAKEDMEALPHLALPLAYTQPAHLAALATLHGLEAPWPEEAHVLELGCGAGANIIPLAARFPAARFLGFDLSSAHAEEANRRIAALGLANVEIRQADVAQLDLGREQFDYVICHGLFSSVCGAAQQAILRLCGGHLAPDGIAAISYNVLPGWHLRKVVRDICLHHAGQDFPPRQRVAAARAVIEQIAGCVPDTEPYGLLLRNEARRTAALPASYIAGEFLAPYNVPCFFHDFMAQAEEQGLGYLCEGSLAESTPQALNPQAAARVRSFAGSSRIAVEAYTDFFTGRTFRRSLLVKMERAESIEGDLGADRLSTLHFASRDRVTNPRDAAVGPALARLADLYPGTASLKELDAEHEPGVRRALLHRVLSGRATVSALPLRVGRETSERPSVWPVARAEAAAGQRWVTSLQHASVPLEGAVADLLPHLDGRKDRGRLADLAGTQPLDRALRYFALNALLEPPPRPG